MGMTFKTNSKPEKLITAATMAVVLSIIFDGKKKKLKNPEKYKNFPKRVVKYYKLSDKLLTKTAAKELEAEVKRHAEMGEFKDKKLDDMVIENGEFIDI